MTIDEAIENLRYDAQCNRADLDIEWAERNEQLAEWLEELKALKSDDNLIFGDGLEQGYDEGYTKAIEDFAEALRLKSLDSVYKEVGLFTILKVAEQLKEGGKDET